MVKHIALPDTQGQSEDQGAGEANRHAATDQSPIDAMQAAGGAQEGQGAAENEPEQDSGAPQGDQTDSTHVYAPYGFRSDGVTPKAKPGVKGKDAVASAERDKQRTRLRSVTQGKGAIQKNLPTPGLTPLSIVNYQALGDQVAGMWFYGGHVLLGDEWAPDAAEKVAVGGAFASYFKATQMNDLPPGVALCFVLGLYTMKRATKPTIQSRLKQFGAWIADKVRFGKGRGLSLVKSFKDATPEGAGL